MISQDRLGSIVGTTAYDRDGDKIGKVGAVYYDDATDQPSWVTVHTGLFGTKETFVPVQGADFSGDRVTLAFDKAKVKDAPNIAEDGHLAPEEEEQLYRYYGVDYGNTAGQYATGQDRDRDLDSGRHNLRDDVTDRDRDGDGVYDDARGAVGRDTSGPTTDEAMTRSEEQLRVGIESREAGRARLRKHVVSERQQVSVPVSREEVTLEREPITDANRGNAYDGPAISEEEHEVTLHAERPVVDTEAVAVERVRLGKETVTENETVGGEVRKEEIEFDEGGRGVRDDRRDDVRTDRR
jgi:uncharacterized protein (TIGR02271 family)